MAAAGRRCGIHCRTSRTAESKTTNKASCHINRVCRRMTVSINALASQQPSALAHIVNDMMSFSSQEDMKNTHTQHWTRNQTHDLQPSVTFNLLPPFPAIGQVCLYLEIWLQLHQVVTPQTAASFTLPPPSQTCQ